MLPRWLRWSRRRRRGRSCLCAATPIVRTLRAPRAERQAKRPQCCFCHSVCPPLAALTLELALRPHEDLFELLPRRSRRVALLKRVARLEVAHVIAVRALLLSELCFEKCDASERGVAREGHTTAAVARGRELLRRVAFNLLCGCGDQRRRRGQREAVRRRRATHRRRRRRLQYRHERINEASSSGRRRRRALRHRRGARDRARRRRGSDAIEREQPVEASRRGAAARADRRAALRQRLARGCKSVERPAEARIERGRRRRVR